MNEKFNFARAFVARTKKPITVLVALVALAVLLFIATPVAIVLLAAAAFAYLFYLIYTGDQKVLKVVDKLLAVVNWFVSVASKVAQKIHDYVHSAAQGASADAAVAKAEANANAASDRFYRSIRTREEKEKGVSDIEQQILALEELREIAVQQREQASANEHAALQNLIDLTEAAQRSAQERDENFPVKARHRK